MITGIARDFVLPEKTEEYRTLIFELIEKTREEPGNISYTLYEDREHDGEFALIEEWKDQESLDGHFKAEHFTRLVPQIRRLLAKPSQFNVYQLIK